MRTRLPQKPHPPVKLEVIFCVRGVVSPLLANLDLHYVLDLWVEACRKKVARGDVIAVRYADDAVLGFQYREEADRRWVTIVPTATQPARSASTTTRRHERINP